MIHTSSNVSHSLASELQEVHELMEKSLPQYGTNNIADAQKMTTWLQMFKTNGTNAIGDTSIMGNIDAQAFAEIAKSVELAIGGRLFQTSYASEGAATLRQSQQVDDIFEAELARLLDSVWQKAVKKTSFAGSQSGAMVLGRESGNLSKALLMELAETEYQKELEEILKNSSYKRRFVGKPYRRSGKVDVSGYAEFEYGVDIDSNWLEFINLFTGKKFSLKNYTTGALHLGNTQPKKAILATLDTILVNRPKKEEEAYHVYYHLAKSSSGSGSEHALDLRFTYELTGRGLYDKENNPLAAVDYLIYNNPAVANQIYVFSTNAAIDKYIEERPGAGDPMHSDIIVSVNWLKKIHGYT